MRKYLLEGGKIMASENKSLTLGGLPWWQAAVVVVIGAACMFLGVQSSSLAGTLCSAFALGVVLYELGEHVQKIFLPSTISPLM